MIVVVIDKLVEVPLAIVVLHIAVGIDQKGSSRIGFIDGVGLAVEEVGKIIARDAEIPSVGFLGRDRVFLPLVEQRGVGVLSIALVAVPLAIEVEAEGIGPLNGKATDEVGRRQAIVELDPLQIGDVLHVALSAPQYHEGRLAIVDYFAGQRGGRYRPLARLAVGPQFYLEVVGHHVVEIDSDNGRRVWTDISRIVEVVVDDDPLWAICGQKARTPEAAEDDRPFGTGADHLLQGGNRLFAGVEVAAGDPHVVAKQRRPPLAIFGRVVAQNHRNRRQRRRALSSGEAAGDQVTSEEIKGGIGVAGID